MARARPEDLIRTVTLLTPITIADAIRNWATGRSSGSRDLIVAGGGARERGSGRQVHESPLFSPRSG